MELDLSKALYASKTLRVGQGEIGGKAKGFLLAREILLSDHVVNKYPLLRPLIDFPTTFCIATDIFDEFIALNQFEPLIRRSCAEEDEAQYGQLRGAFVQGNFPDSAAAKLAEILQTISFPLAIRSSSLLEDRPGTSFAGKYETTFISNRGSADVRLKTLLQAIKGVYASTYNPNAMAYRRKRALSHREEKMAILLQELIGREYQGCFLPLMAGVGFSRNGYLWTNAIRKEDGIVRLVFGLGTRAVGRGYARLFSPAKPLLRPEGNDAAAIEKFSQGFVDALDLAKNEHVSFPFSAIVKNGIDGYPRSQCLFSLREGSALYRPVSNLWNPDHKPVLTFDAVLEKPWHKLHLPPYIRQVFQSLEEGFGMPVDIEFAVRVDDAKEEAHLYVVQARPLSQHESMVPRPIPKDIPREDQIIFARRNIPSGRVRNIEYLVAVESQRYSQWPLDERHAVARMIGKVNRALQGKVFVLIGPGRWGSVNPELGVSTKYSEISNCALLCEVARTEHGYTPEVSFGTHFFQDLIEDGIVYMPLYPDEPGVLFNEAFFAQANALNVLLAADYDPAYEELIRVIHIPSVTHGRFATAALNGETDEAIVYVKRD